MKHKNYIKNVILPSVDIILALLNNDSRKDIDLLDFYDGYIHAVATEPVYTFDGIKTGYFVNEDLVQEIRIELLKSLPTLRKKLMKEFSHQESENTSDIIMIKI